MGFDTIPFWIIFIFLVVIYQFLKKKVSRNCFLLIASYAFYAMWDIRFLPFIAISTIVDFTVAPWAGPENKSWKRKTALFSSLSVNLGLLCTCKYLVQLFDIKVLHTWFGTSVPDILAEIGLPLGISFYTFQTLSYTLDVYRGKIKATGNIMDFALYVSFFPQLLAGPIEKARRLLPQISSDRNVSGQDYREGFTLILLGIYKKVYIADSLGIAIDFVFEQKNMEASLIILASILMTFRVYADFSGYSDMARGMARFFGIQLIRNFKPFFHVTSPRSFWRSWHISFMEWVRDYLILPLHKRKRNEWITSLHILLTLITVGLWHKASWNWFFFGLLHGSALILSRQWNIFLKKRRLRIAPPVASIFGLLFMLMLYFFSGLFHRSADTTQMLSMLNSVASFGGWHHEVIDYLLYALQFLGPLFVYESIGLVKKDEFFILKCSLLVRSFLVAFVISSIVMWERVTESGFIYFDF